MIIASDRLLETERGSRFLSLIARLRASFAVEDAQAAVAALAQQLALEHPGDYEASMGFRISVAPFRREVVGDLRGALLMLSGAVGFVLLIACANLANLMLVRAAGRYREFVIRAAIGATRWRLAKQVLAESVLVSAAGAGTALLGTYWAVNGLQSVLPARIGVLPAAAIDVRVLAFTALVAALTGMLVGVVPALTAGRASLSDALRSAGSAAQDRGRVRHTLVIAEIAMALVLLTGAGLMIQSFLRLRAVTPGFNPREALSLQLTMGDAAYPTPETRADFVAAALERVRSLPGVTSAGAVLNLPISGGNWDWTITIDGQPERPGLQPQTDFNVVTPGYFDAMQIPLLAGRDLSDRDRASSPGVVVVSEAFAHRYFDGSPLGARFKLGGTSSPNPWLTIVGVVGDVRSRGLHTEVRPMIYVPHAQITFPLGSMTVVARSSTVGPAALAAPVVRAIRTIDRDQPVPRLASLTAVVSESIAERRFFMMLGALFAALALALAMLGVYGTLSYTVALRRPEIGIRMALGARHADVLGMVLRHALLLTAVGVALGMSGSALLTHLLETRLFATSARDPATFAATALIVTLVAAAAACVPARRATRVDPLTSLQSN